MNSFTMKPIMPCLWLNDKIEEAVNFYVSVFPDSKITDTRYFGDAGPLPKGTVLTMTFQLRGEEFMAINGGAEFPFSPAVSFFVNCKDQKDPENSNRVMKAMLQARHRPESMVGIRKIREAARSA